MGEGKRAGDARKRGFADGTPFSDFHISKALHKTLQMFYNLNQDKMNKTKDKRGAPKSAARPLGAKA